MIVRPPLQYEVNGSTELCDAAMPTTTSCPYLPGQKVNTLYIPQERATRQRRASLSSLDEQEYRTMNPHAKFVTPQPAPAAHADLCARRTGTASAAVDTAAYLDERPVTAHSPTKTSWKRFFPKTLISRPPTSRGRAMADDHRSLTSASSNYDIRPQTASDGSRTREISPESLRRFLSDEMSSVRPVSRGSLEPNHAPATEVLDEVDDDDDDDDHSVGDLAAPASYVEESPLLTRLSPPPFRRNMSPATATNSSALTLVPSPRRPPTAIQTGDDLFRGLLIAPVPQPPPAQLSVPESPTLSLLDTSAQSTGASSTLSSALNSPASPTSAEFPSFYDEAHEDDDDIDERFPFSGGDAMDTPSGNPGHSASRHVKVPSTASFSRYRLPQLTYTPSKPAGNDAPLPASPQFATVTSPMLLARPDEAAAHGGANLLGSSIDLGLDDFATELSWMADSITSRH